MADPHNSPSLDIAEIHRILRTDLSPQALNAEWQTEEQILDLLNSSRKLESLSSSLSPLFEVLKKMIDTIPAAANLPDSSPAGIVYGVVGDLLQVAAEQPSLIAPIERLLGTLYTQLKPLQQSPPPSLEPTAVKTSARILNLFAVVLARAHKLSGANTGSRIRAFGGSASTEIFSSDHTIVDSFKRLGWFVEDLEWLSYDMATMKDLAWTRGAEKYEKCKDGIAGSSTPMEVSSIEELVSQLEDGSSGSTLNKETKRLRETIKQLGSDIERLCQSEYGDRCKPVLEAMSNLISVAKGNKTSVHFVSDVFVDLHKHLPKAEALASTPDFSTRFLLYILEHLGIALTELRNYEIRWTASRLTSSKKSLAKTSDVLYESFSKLDHLKTIYRAESYAKGKFEEMWDEATASYIRDTGEDPTQLVTDVKNLDDLQEAIKKGEYDFIRSRSQGSEVRQKLDAIVRFLSRHTVLAGEFGAGLGFEQAKIISTAVSLLLEASSAKAVTTSYDQVEELFRRLSEIVERVETYSPDVLRPQLREVLVEELCHVLRILGIATKGVKRSEKFFKALANQKDDIPTVLTKLKELIEKERGIVGALTLRTVEDIYGKVENMHHILEPFAANQGPKVKLTTLRKPALPPPSAFFLGRDTETAALIESVLKFESSVICGLGGIGKTSLSLQVLHDEQVRSHFRGRYFVRCEGTTTLDLLYTEIANCIGISVVQRDQVQLKEQILDSLQNTPTVLCLDNFETLWEIEQTRFDVEQALKSFVDLPTASILVSMRGSREPGSIPWSRPLSKSLQPLAHSDAFALFQKHSECNDDDPYAHRLVEAMDSIPLAVVLLAYQARGEDETTEELWKRWEKDGTSIVSRGQSGGRHLHLEASIELSLNGPRMRDSSLARQTLALLSLLPGGLDKTGNIFEALCKVEELDGLQDSLRLLSDTALAFLDSNLSGRRYRILAPISRFSRQHLLQFLPLPIQSHLILIYVQFMSHHSPYIPEHHQVVPSELSNSHSVLKFAVDGKLANMRDVIGGILSETRWMEYLGVSTTDLLLLALQDGTLGEDDEGRCFQLQGELYFRQDQLKDAETCLLQALMLHQRVHDVPGEGVARSRLGELYLRQNRLEEAERSLLEAMKLHEQAHEVLSQGTSIIVLGEVYLRQYRLEEAETSLLEGMKLYQEAQSVLGEGNCMQVLGELYLHQGRLEEAETSLLEAMKLCQQAHSVLGEGSCMKTLGKLYLRQDRFKEAETSLLEAMKLHQKAHDFLGQGNDRNILGELYLRQFRLEEAESSLLDALKFYQQAHYVLGEGNARELLGQLYRRQDRLEEAETSILDAIKLHKKVHDVRNEGHDRGTLGHLYLRQDRLEEAETFLLEALKLHQQVHDDTWVEYDRSLLKEISRRKGQLNDADRGTEEEGQSDSESIGTSTTDEQYFSCDNE